MLLGLRQFQGMSHHTIYLSSLQIVPWQLCVLVNCACRTPWEATPRRP